LKSIFLQPSVGSASTDPGRAGSAFYGRPTGQTSEQGLIGIFSTAGHDTSLSGFFGRWAGSPSLLADELFDL
jgi:hypothetical protein